MVNPMHRVELALKVSRCAVGTLHESSTRCIGLTKISPSAARLAKNERRLEDSPAIVAAEYRRPVRSRSSPFATVKKTRIRSLPISRKSSVAICERKRSISMSLRLIELC